MYREEEKIREIIDIVLDGTNYRIYQLDIDPPRGNAWIRLRIDADFPITIRDCEIVNKKIRSFLDLEGLSDIYSLEVSSPGAEREIFLPDEAERFYGRYVKIRYLRDDNKVVDIIGRLGKILDDNKVEIMVDKSSKKNEVAILDLERILKANLYLKM